MRSPVRVGSPRPKFDKIFCVVDNRVNSKSEAVMGERMMGNPEDFRVGPRDERRESSGVMGKIGRALGVTEKALLLLLAGTAMPEVGALAAPQEQPVSGTAQSGENALQRINRGEHGRERVVSGKAQEALRRLEGIKQGGLLDPNGNVRHGLTRRLRPTQAGKMVGARSIRATAEALVEEANAELSIFQAPDGSSADVKDAVAQARLCLNLEVALECEKLIGATPGEILSDESHPDGSLDGCSGALTNVDATNRDVIAALVAAQTGPAKALGGGSEAEYVSRIAAVLPESLRAQFAELDSEITALATSGSILLATQAAGGDKAEFLAPPDSAEEK